MSRSAPRSRPWLAPALAVALVALGVGGFLGLFERVEEEREIGYRGEARSNPLYASQEMLRELGVPARTTPALLPLPPTDRTLVVFAPRVAFGPSRAARLRDWVAAGGTLVVTPRQAGGPDPLLKPLGVERLAAKETPQSAEGRADGDAGRDAEDVLVGVSTAPALPPLRVAPGTTVRVRDTSGRAVWAGGPSEAPLLLRYRFGRGTITVLADRGFARNDRIGREQNATFLWQVVRAAGVPRGVVLIWRDEGPDLAGAVLARGWAALAAGALLLAAWLWRHGSRFGPLLAEAAPVRRSLLEHLRASGEFLWRHGRGQALLRAERQALARRLGERHPGWQRLSERERVAQVARLAAVPPGVLAAALEERPVDDLAQLARTIATLERARRSL